MTAINEGTSLTVEDGVAIVTLDFPPVNAMSPALMDGLYDALMAALSDDAAKAIVLICAGRTFIAGADLKSLGKVQPKVDFFALQDSIENSPKPTVAALHGTALGGGMETALTFHYRIAVPSARMGLPEVNLGLLPGGGGTQRLPRITGAEAALDLLISGRQVGAKEALTIGLIDRLAAEGALREDAIAFAKELVDAGEPPKRIRDCEAKVAADRKDANLFERFRTSHAKQLNGLDAPQAIVRCVEAAVAGPWEKGLAIERTEFQTLLAGPQSAALRHVFMAERAAQKIPGLRADLPLIPVTKVGIVGAGTMGSGIAMAFLAAGFAVTVVETQQAALDRGVAHITATLQSRVERGKLAADKAEAQIAALTPTLDLSALADADLVVEAIFENLAAKQALFGTLSAIVRPDTILATNTSFLDVDAIAAGAAGPERVLGMHFFSPANVMRLLEVVRAAKTSEAVLASVMALAKKLGKAAVVSGVCFGFIGNRMLAARQVHADAMVLAGVLPWNIDRILTGFGFPMGPFAMLDLAGLDIGWEGDTDSVKSRLVAAGRKGQKSGAGYYDYENKTPSPSQTALDVIAGLASVAPGSVTLSDREILDRLLLPMINEGAKILEEGIALRGSDIDLVWITGYGWPAQTGGPMFHADAIGLTRVVDGLRHMGVEPAALLLKLASEGGSLAAYAG
ncbi:3-hydroxyacyl-CoA dehydrogenase [Sphingomonas koreensis]|jgi:3-hydroxyacyl-CoA dehydrogenase|uniref:3-hydroxyacyl-CoA dehydrogenase NAD-binding domain-containing protein n=1 Tax=Sphingomonas koreensis TaxID=93064 RepID=UPI00083181C1|nr:3-hydroxyacyl-CoA dehydrogenase NAD-binding domain-containing protein [Sphingomonas koreensis]PJI89512.1 3-hydroxyacyl-CoA dehydrogenase [Sphingomonas koreensis]RSU56889.1 3-hydroxyacyl-CoA dehydrogenase [Sphingomonas koreensis]RSU65249.1 3-hydroxyacyl-CoA dehydrogenase [Sphingomonas koreensis]